MAQATMAVAAAVVGAARVAAAGRDGFGVKVGRGVRGWVQPPPRILVSFGCNRVSQLAAAAYVCCAHDIECSLNVVERVAWRGHCVVSRCTFGRGCLS